MPQTAKFLTGEAALLTGKTLAVADLHLGLEKELENAGLRIPSQEKRLTSRLLRLIEQTNAKEVIINGDLKHDVLGLKHDELEQALSLVQAVEQNARVLLVKGNHDSLLQNALPVHAFIRRNGAYFTHGHAKPCHARRNETIITAHVHPAVQFTDSLGGRTSERAWLAAPKRIIMPAFNPLLGSADIRGKTKELIKDADVFLLDGLCLGKAADLRRKK